MRTREVIVFVRRGDEVLAVHRSPDQGGYWHSVAGGVEEGESYADAAVRELEEETGLVADVASLERTFAYEGIRRRQAGSRPSTGSTTSTGGCLPRRRRSSCSGRSPGISSGRCDRTGAAVPRRRAARSLARDRRDARLQRDPDR
ncbi:MAG: NUDIX hydrolase [Actinobacteria bacterium]|nr:MAG: NUDIX hydrolase [Actinomycetota bacterium]